ncbi:tyrosine-protein kinase JAK3 isoform X2 [Calypte anna]|uniref:tyrosine-protein kinase JAK3 isoform X2 n=1 Tax=Calypte anna TaxID=9244 RepID=UPI0011C40258|nr:tyrosine-protein kinase JAK3 isoform X2 [Calypte anna]
MAPLGEETPLIRERSCSLSSAEAPSLQVLLYHPAAPPQHPPDTPTLLTFTFGEYTAEELCVHAAKACGVSPICHPLFALATEDLSCWFPPSHLFTPDTHPQVLLYRIRFFFPNWCGLVRSHRFQLPNDQASPILDCQVLDYLFAQSRSDFIRGGVAVPLSLPSQEQCLSLALLDMLRLAHEQSWSPQEVLSYVSYKSCLPVPLRSWIQQRSFLTRKRLRRRFGTSLRRLARCQADGRALKLKYLLDLERLARSWAQENFQGRSPGSGTAISIQVAGESGVSWSCGGSEGHQHFCDFPDITDITIKQSSAREGGSAETRVVTITKTDNRVLEVEFPSLRDARSLVALLDGYHRLTAAPQHYFCREVAPPRLLEDLENQCHGPISAEFAVKKLKAAGGQPGLYLLRRSPQDFDSFLVTVCVQTRSGPDFKQCQIHRDAAGGFWLLGVSQGFCSLREVLDTYRHQGLQAEGTPLHLATCCVPQPRDRSNLLIIRSGCPRPPPSPAAPHRSLTQMMFHKIDPQSLTWGESLAQGSFTRIYKGIRRDQEQDGAHQTPVVLKVMDSTHQNCAESFLEAASIMSQLSHKHLVLLHGVSLGKDSIMVQEYVRYGPLDLYLKKKQGEGKVTTSWKLQVAKQLAYALNYLEDRKITHGNVSAKKVLLTREGDSASPPFIKLNDPGVSVTVLAQDKTGFLPEPAAAPGASLARTGHTGCPVHGLRAWTPALLPRPPPGPQQPHQLRLRAALRPLPPRAEAAELLLGLRAPRPLPGPPTLRGEAPQGNFGSVELCRYDPLGDSTGELVAVKRLQQDSAQELRDFQREIQILHSLHHEFIVRYRGVCSSRGSRGLRLVMEYLPKGCLRDYLQKNRSRLDRDTLLLYAWQICKGMEYLGGQRCVHRDLASRNILVESQSHVKIGDFGLAKLLPQDKEYYVVREPGQSPIFWYAPESLADNVFSRASDIWSFGVLLYELFTYGSKSRSPSEEFLHMMGTEKPAQIICHLLELLRDNQRLPAPPGCPGEVYTLMLSCWAFTPGTRPTFGELLPKIEALRDHQSSACG